MKTAKLLYLLLLGCTFLLACEAEELTQRNFFFSNNQAATVTGQGIGRFRLRANTDLVGEALGDCEGNIAFGFYFGTDSTAVENGTATVIPPQNEPIDGNIEAFPPVLSPGVTYFYRPFAICGPREVGGRTGSIFVDVSLTMTANDRPRRNDTLSFRIETTGDNFIAPGAERGYYLLSGNGTDTLTAPLFFAITETDDIDIIFPEFNSDYILLPVVREPAGVFFGTPLPVRIDDGWRRIRNLPLALQDARVVVMDGVAYLFSGLENYNGFDVNDSIYRLQFAPGTPYNEIGWDVVVPMGSTAGFTNRIQGVAFGRNDTIFHGMGQKVSAGLPYSSFTFNTFLPADIRMEGELFPSVPARLVDAVAFTQNSKTYIGSGINKTDNQPGQFYQFTDDLRIISEQAEGPLSEGALVGAVSVSYNESVLVGGGFNLARHEADFYRFNDGTETWSSVAFFPTPRRDAASFSIGGRAFIGFGWRDFDLHFRDLYEYDQFRGWMPLHPLPAPPRAAAVGFSINGYGCICGGFGVNSGLDVPVYADCWLYVPKPGA